MNSILAQVRSITNIPEQISGTIAWWKIAFPAALALGAIAWVVDKLKKKK
jgi:hypothetical protein